MHASQMKVQLPRNSQRVDGYQIGCAIPGGQVSRVGGAKKDGHAAAWDAKIARNL
jgi:hypothetical protein